MSRKINSVSLRLGLFQVWSVVSTCYGKNLNPYQFFWLKLNLENYIRRVFTNERTLFGGLYWMYKSNQILVIINYINILNLVSITYKFYVYLHYVVKQWSSLPISIYIFEINQLNTASFISSYICSSLNKNVPFKSIFNTIQLNTKRVIYTVNGPSITKLIGLKVKYSGKINGSRNPMSKSLKISMGPVALSTISNYVDYDYKIIYTKLGVCSVHVWITYTIYRKNI